HSRARKSLCIPPPELPAPAFCKDFLSWLLPCLPPCNPVRPSLLPSTCVYVPEPRSSGSDPRLRCFHKAQGRKRSPVKSCISLHESFGPPSQVPVKESPPAPPDPYFLFSRYCSLPRISRSGR